MGIQFLTPKQPQPETNDVYVMIVTDRLYVDLRAVPLVEHRRVHLYLDRQTYNTCLKSYPSQQAANLNPTTPPTILPNSRLTWDGRLWTLVNLGETATTLLPEVGQPLQLPSAFFLQLLDGGTVAFPFESWKNKGLKPLV